MSLRSRYAGIGLGVMVTLAAGILIGRGINSKDADVGAITAGPSPYVPESPGKAGGPNAADERPRRQLPPARGGDDDRLQDDWGLDDDTQEGRERQIGTPIQRTKEPVHGGKSRRPRGAEGEPEAGPPKPEPERRGGASDAVDA
jgi:hypothetical protein